ncbi:hypothetical protein INT47_001554 [Mucor saturninus]|uniref:Uncharacterized protein n=1 Tax=Mucor saturninus TaxID=64648 RepID=A0A8H7UZ10_9FUNG|nr:hypothetical protein INT47_001554 [Mucor saturninus]
MKWLPLPKIAHGIAIYPFSPSTAIKPSGQLTPVPNDDASIHTNASSSSMDLQPQSTNEKDYSHLISLEVGDELFVFEQQGQWYRGYVICPLEEGRKPNKAPIGIFPRSHVAIKEYLDIDPDEADTLAFRRHGLDRPLSEIPNGLPRSFSESFIQPTSPLDYHSNYSAGRPGSFGDLNFESETENTIKTVLHIPPPPLPLARFDQSTVTGSSEPLVDEIAACVSEWNSLLYTYINQRQYNLFNTVRDHINYLFQARRQLLDQALSREELFKLRKDIIQRMVIGNMDQHQPMIIRHPQKGYLLDANNASLSNIYRMHWKYATSFINNNEFSTTTNTATNATTTTTTTTTAPSDTVLLQNTPNQQQQQQQASHPKGAKFHHLFFELKACVAQICQAGEFTELYFALYSATEQKFLTEQFVVVLNYNGMPKDETQIGKMRALFVDLSLHDLTDNLYLVCHIVRLGGMKWNDKDQFYSSSIFHSNKHQSFQKQQFNGNAVSTLCKRPFGCAVLKLSSILNPSDPSSTTTTTTTNSSSIVAQSSLVEYDMPIYVPISESTYTSLHESIIFGNAKEFQTNPRAETLRISVRTFFGYLDELLKTNAALLGDVPKTLRLGFADVVFPDDGRNELYITLESGDFTQFNRSRNIQVAMCVRDNKTGEVIENAISIGAGTRPVSSWESMIMYHEQRPKWGEMIKIHIKDNHQWERSHVFLTIKHKSSSYNGSGANPAIIKFGSNEVAPNEKIISMGFLPLFLPPLHRDFIADGTHTLYLYKYDRQVSTPKNYLENTPWCLRSSSPSNMVQQNMDYLVRVRSPTPLRKMGHQHSPSNQSFKSATGSFSSSAFGTSAPNSVSDLSLGQNKLTSLRDTLVLSTFLCSTQFTQNKTLVKLLNWRTLMEGTEDGTVELLSILDQFTFVGEVEVVKFLGDIFDALLDILAYPHDEDQLNDEINNQVLAAIIWLLGIVQDRRFSNFRPVLDVYIKNRFSIQEYERNFPKQQTSDGEANYSYRPVQETTYQHLIASLSRLCSDHSKAKLLRSSMKVWDYLFRFIVRSRLNQQEKEEEGERARSDRQFRDDLNKLLEAITSIMSSDQPSSMIGTQTLTLQHFADILEELHKIFSPQEVVQIAVSFVDSCSHVTGRLVGFKLAMILTIVKGSTFHETRLDLAKNVFRWIRLWVNSYGSTAKDVIFARQVEQQDPSVDLNHAQTRLPRGQWVENLRLSLTIMSEVLDKVRKSFGMASSGLSSSCVYSPSFQSRPTSLATTVDEDYNQHDLNTITDAALQLIPQLIHAYKDIQKMTIQAMHVSAPTETYTRPHSRQSISILRERSTSIGNNTKSSIMSPDILQEIKGALPASNASTTTLSGNSNMVLQALSTSPAAPFPSTYPFQPRTVSTSGLTSDHAAMLSTGLLDLSVVILELFYLTPKQQWTTFIKKMYEQEGIEETCDFLCKVVYMCMSILFGDNIMTLEETSLDHDAMSLEEDDDSKLKRKLPDHWLNLSTIAHQIVLCDVLEPIKSILEMPAFTPAAYDNSPKVMHEQKSALLLWRVYFVGFLRVVGSPQLEVAEFMPQSQRAVWKIIGNMRGEVGAKVFLSLWHTAGASPSSSSLSSSTAATVTDRSSEPGRDSTDYFNSQSPVMTDHAYFTEDSRMSMASIEEVDDDDIRHSVRIGPTDEVPLSSIHEEENECKSHIVAFLQEDLAEYILSPLCAVSLTLHDRVRSNAIAVMADIIAIELYTFGELHNVQHALISTLDRLVMYEEKGDEVICSRISIELATALETRLQTADRNDLIVPGLRAVDSICKFLSLLLQIRSLPLDDDEFMDERITSTLKLMKFIQVIEREEIYIKYVHQLVQLHLDSRNFIEAALTLQFHADLLAWDPSDQLPAIPELGLKLQSSFHRKEGLYMKMITYLDQGCAWELCIQLCKTLAYEYETTLYDFVKLSDILLRQSTLAENIVKKERCFTEYFRVGFYGRGFPASNRNQQYIYRGLEWEKMPSFVERMQNRHPNAQLLSSKISNAVSVSEEQLKELESTLDGQYLQITSVTPIPDMDNHCLSNPIVPDCIKKYYYFNNVSKFSFSRPVIRPPSTDIDTKQPESDFLNLWTEKVDFECEDRFPTIVRRSKIIHSQLIVVSPIENAVKAMENKNNELISLEKKYAVYLNQHHHTNININPFSMSLNGAVDAPVNGGVPLYKKAFLSKAYWDKNPEMRPWIQRLQDAIYHQVRIIQKCLNTHNQLVSAEMRPFHTTLTEFFHKNFAEEIKTIKEQTQQEAVEQVPLSITTTGSTVSRRRSTISSCTTEVGMEDSIKSRQSSTISQTPGIGGVPVLPQLPVMSPISRAFSIRTPVTDSMPGSPHSPTAFEHATMSRAESISRTLKMSLRSKKLRKKSTL